MTSTHVQPEHHAPGQAHHFHTMEQQTSAGRLGMWVFLAQEILFFSGLFLAYFTARYFYPDTFLAAHEYLDATLGGINTAVLLASSLTMALAVRCAQTNSRKGLIINLAITILFAVIFMVVKYFEYSHKFHLGLFPGTHYAGPEIPGRPGIFFGLYFVLTGIHAIHIIGGIIAMIWLIVRTQRGEFSSQNFVAVENVGLYWHLVDLIWIYLFPLLYLVK